jgi:hypothetical protein
MSQFTVTHARANKTSDDPKSPHYQNAPQSLLEIVVRAATPEGATKKAEAFWAPRPEWSHGTGWSVLSVEDHDANPE